MEVTGNGANQPASFQLGQNFPNPFVAQTVIPYTIARPGNVKIVVFDITGRRVNTITRQHNQTGTFQIHWDGRDNTGRPVPSGAYFYSFQSHQKQWTRRMTIVR